MWGSPWSLNESQEQSARITVVTDVATRFRQSTPDELAGSGHAVQALMRETTRGAPGVPRD
jgi:hypothetical protein